MRVLIIGARGMLGTDLLKEWDKDELIPASSQDADVRIAEQVHRLVARTRPDCTVLTAAYTDVDGSERNPENAFAVNARGVENVARAAKELRSRLFFVSTDYVFDGTSTRPYEPDDLISPLNVYGQSKAAGEKAIREHHSDWCIARTSWLFGTGGKCFPDTILKLAASRPALEVVNDQRGCPTYSVDLARVIIELCRNHARGIVHATNSGNCSWFEFASEIVNRAHLATEVRPVSSQQVARPAPRPAYSVLSGKSLQRYEIAVPMWQDGLERYLVERNN